MKKFIILVLAITLLGSCKKDRHCECDVKTTSAGTTNSSSVSYTYHKVSKHQANGLCKDQVQELTSGSKTEQTCILK